MQVIFVAEEEGRDGVIVDDCASDGETERVYFEGWEEGEGER